MTTVSGIHFYSLSLADGIQLVHGVQVAHAFPRHLHASLAIGIIEQGERVFTIREKTVPISVGRCFIINPGEPHACVAEPTQPHTYWTLCIPPHALQTLLADSPDALPPCPYFPHTNIEDSALFAKIKLLGELVIYSDDQFEQESVCLDILTHCVKHHSQTPQEPHSAPPHYSVLAVRDYLDQHFDQPIRLAQLAKMAHTSPFYLNRVFQHDVGLPPYEYLVQVRLKQAQRLLRSGMSIAETAYHTGFADQSHLTRFFKRHVGMTPRAFLKS